MIGDLYTSRSTSTQIPSAQTDQKKLQWRFGVAKLHLLQDKHYGVCFFVCLFVCLFVFCFFVFVFCFFCFCFLFLFCFCFVLFCFLFCFVFDICYISSMSMESLLHRSLLFYLKRTKYFIPMVLCIRYIQNTFRQWCVHAWLCLSAEQQHLPMWLAKEEDSSFVHRGNLKPNEDLEIIMLVNVKCITWSHYDRLHNMG